MESIKRVEVTLPFVPNTITLSLEEKVIVPIRELGIDEPNEDGVVKWLGRLPDVSDSQMFAGIELKTTCEKAKIINSNGCYGGISYFCCHERQAGVFLPVEFVARHCSGKDIVEIPTPSYPMNVTPHGIALIVEQDVLNSKCVEAFRYLRYNVRFCLPSQMTQQTKEIIDTNHTIYDSFICYISSCKSDEINELVSKVQQCSSLQGKPKLFFIQSDSEPFQNIGADMFTAWINHKDEIGQMQDKNHLVSILGNLLMSNANIYDVNIIMEKFCAIASLHFIHSGKFSIYFKSTLSRKVIFLAKDYTPMLDKAFAEGYIIAKWTKLTISGPPKSGRSSVMKLLLHDPEGSETDRKRDFAMNSKVEIIPLITEGETPEQPWKETNCVSTKALIAKKIGIHKEVHTDDCKSTSTKPMSTINESTALHETHWITVIDSGGQPAFLDIAPPLLHYNAVNILTLKLNENLEDKTKFYYSIKGETFNQPDEHQITHKQLFEASFCSLLPICSPDLPNMYSFSTEFKDPFFLILGTFLDELIHAMAEANQKVENLLKEKNDPLFSSLKDFQGLSQIINYKQTRNQLIFPLNATARSKEELKIAMSIRKKVSKHFIKAKIPARWFLFQLDLNEYQKTTKNPIISKSECIRIGRALKMDDLDVETALKYYHDLTMFLYFHDILPHVVFLHPQPLFDKLSELISISVEDVVEYLEDEDVDLPNQAHVKLKKKGLFTRELLDTFEFYNNFEKDDFLKLMDHLSIFAHLPECKHGEEFFFPNVLPTIATSSLPEDLIDSFKKRFDPLIFTWNMKPLPPGLFTAIVVSLLNSPTFDLPRTSNDEQHYRNIIYLSCRILGGAVLLVNATFWLEIYYSGQAINCLDVRDAVYNGIKTVAKKFKYKPIHLEPQESFHCIIHNVTNHLCQPSKDKQTLTCCQEEWRNDYITPRQIVWIIKTKDIVLILKKEPETGELLSLLEKSASKWKRIGHELKVDDDFLGGLSAREKPDSDKMDDVVSEWKRKLTTPTTWESVLSALENVGEVRTAKKIRENLAEHEIFTKYINKPDFS